MLAPCRRFAAALRLIRAADSGPVAEHARIALDCAGFGELDDMNSRMTNTFARSVVVAAVLLGVAPSRSWAADDNGDTVAQTDTPLSADVKGTVGLGLIGAELGMVIPALAGARGVWPYIVFPVIGAGGGAVAGYFLLEKGDHAELAVASLVAGMALAVPALVATLAATAYEPDTESPMARAAAAGPGLLRWSEGSVYVAPPGVSASRSDAREALRTGAPRNRTVSVALLSGRF
jgi:hypothetical protein